MTWKVRAEREELGQKPPGATTRQQAPNFANVRSYSEMHRSGMSSDAGQSVAGDVTAHGQGLNRGADTSTALNSEFNRRVRVSFRARKCRQRGQRRRTARYSESRA